MNDWNRATNHRHCRERHCNTTHRSSTGYCATHRPAPPVHRMAGGLISAGGITMNDGQAREFATALVDLLIES